VFETKSSFLDITGFCGGVTGICIKIPTLIEEGWLEEVKPESLADALHPLLYNRIGTSGCLAMAAKCESHYFSEEKIEKLKKTFFKYPTQCSDHWIDEIIAILKGDS